MEDKNVRIEKLKAAQEKIDRKIKKLEEVIIEEVFVTEKDADVEEMDEDDAINVSKNCWKKATAVASIAAVVGAGAFLAIRQPWKSAKVIYHFIHLV